MVINLVDSVADLSTLLSSTFQVAGSVSLLCVLGSHLLIHLREVAEDGQDEGTSYRSKPLSAIDFEQGTELNELSEHGLFSHVCNSIHCSSYLGTGEQSQTTVITIA